MPLEQTPAQREAAFRDAGLTSQQRANVIAGVPSTPPPIDPVLAAFNQSMVSAPRQAPAPIPILSSQAGQQITDKNVADLQKMESAYTGPSIVDYLKSIGQDSSLEARKKLGGSAGIDFSKSTDQYATQNTQLLNVLRNPTGSPAVQTQVDDVNKIASTGNLNPQQQAQLNAVQQTQDAITSAQAAARQAYEAGDYGGFDDYMKSIRDSQKMYTDALSQFHKDVAPLRQQYAKILKPSDLETQLGTQLADLTNQIDQFNIQTEEDKFREYEGQTLGFAGGRAAEIDIRAEFKRQRMAMDQKNLLSKLGLAQDAREMEGKSLETQMNWIADDFDLQTKIQDRLDDSEEKLFNVFDKLDQRQKDQLSGVLESLQGRDPDEMPAQAKAQLDQIIAQLGLSPQRDAIYDAMRLQSDQLKFENALEASQEARSGAAAGDSGFFTKTQIATGAAQARLSINEFKALPIDLQNEFIYGMRGRLNEDIISFLQLAATKGEDLDDTYEKLRTLIASAGYDPQTYEGGKYAEEVGNSIWNRMEGLWGRTSMVSPNL